MKYYSKLEFNNLDDEQKMEYYENLRAEKNEAVTPDRMEEIAAAFDSIRGYYNASEFARDLKKDALKQRAAEEKMRKEKRKKVILISVGVLAAAVLIISITIIASMLNTKDEQYKKAVELYNNEKYAEAKEIFETLGDYENSKLYLTSINGVLGSMTFEGTVIREGSEITFGSLDQDGIEGAEALKWFVIEVDKDSGRALLISKDIIGYASYDGEDWKNSGIRSWLNSDFYDAAFTSEERARVIRYLYSEYRGEDENDVIYEVADSISLLSRAEYEKYMTFGSAVSSALWSDKLKGEFELSGRGEWLMRTVLDNGNVMNVTSSGAKNNNGISVEENCGIRPIMWVELDKK